MPPVKINVSFNISDPRKLNFLTTSFQNGSAKVYLMAALCK